MLLPLVYIYIQIALLKIKKYLNIELTVFFFFRINQKWFKICIVIWNVVFI